MKKQRGKMRKQIMAVVLSVAMMVSNLSVAAAEQPEVIATEAVTVVEETTEATSAAVETSSAVETESSAAETSSTVVIEDQEVATTAQTPQETSASEESTTKATEEVADEGVSSSEEEDTTTVETTVEATEVESTEEATTEEETTEVETTAEAVMLLADDADVNVAQDITVSTADEFVEAISAVQPGYAIKVKAGTYKFSKSILIEESNAGIKDAMKKVVADGGEVVFDFSDMGYSGSDADKSNRGIILDGSYWHFYGIKIKNAADNGMLLSGDNNLIEMCVFEGNHDTGLQISRYQTGYELISQWPSNNTIKNCTSFNNVDIEGENADGFAAKLTCGEGNVFDGCMAYNNSDDGWDLYAKTATGPIGVVTLKNCIAFRNGKLTDGSGSAQGDMNGFKLGGSGVGTPHVLVNCIAFENGAHGFTDNNNPTAVSLTNCTSFNNSRYESKKSNFQMNRENGGINSNLLSFTTDSMGSDAFIGTINNSVYYNNKPAYYSVVEKTAIAKGDKLGEIVEVTASDFVSVTAPSVNTDFHTEWRNADGSIDTKGFLKVASNSAYATMASDGQALGARLSGDEYADIAPDSGSTDDGEKEEDKDSTVGTIGGTDTSINVSDLTAGTITTSTEVGDFILNANSSKTIVIEANKKSIDGFDFTQRLKLGGTGKTDYRNIEYTATDAATMTVYAMSGSGSANRALVLVDQDGNQVASQVALGAEISKLTYEIPKAGTYYLYSADSGINVYYVAVDYEEVEEQPVKPELPKVDAVESVDGKIDVWDFAAEQLDSATYNNMLTEDIINSWYPDKAAGTGGVNIATFQVKDTDGTVLFGFNDGGYPATHRLRTMNTNLTRYDEKNKSFGGVTYNGFIYSNKAASSDVYVEMHAQAGDIFTLAVSSNGTEAEYVFEAPSGEKQTGIYDASEAGTLLTFYASETGTYKLYTTKEKLVLLRAYVQHTQPVNVVGYVEAPASLAAEYAVTFTNTSTGVVTEAVVSNGTYKAVLHEAYTYEVALKNADGYVVISDDALTLNVGDGGEENYKQFDITVGAVALANVTGSLVGIDAETAAKLTVSLKADQIYVPVVTIEGTKWSAKLETGIEYKVEISGINDYELVSPTTIMVTEETTKDIEIAKKPVYDVTLDLVGATADDLAEASFIFTNLNEEGYVYTFTGTEGIQLRDGVYSVVVENSGAYVQMLTSNVKVDGAAVTKTIKFDSDITEWVFTDSAFTSGKYANALASEQLYNGLSFINGKSHNNTYLYMGAGKVSVPVKGDCTITVNACYQYSFYFENESEASVGVKTGSTGQIDAFSYDYKGDAGMVDITFLGSSYVNSIAITEKVEYKEVITVGATGCDYTTINEALDAVRAMDRTDAQRVTIEIQPGDYEEMLVIDTPNVTLKNASKTPSIETKNKGVDIDDDAVRITSYYGHGYTYYSMGSDCKYSEEILAVNKENGYASFENPGSGTTAGSYWNATVVINANGVEAEGIIFENSFNQYVSKKAANDVIVAQTSAKEGSVPRAEMKAGDTTVQDKKYVERAAALAIYNNCKEVSFDNCKFIGRQDTLYGGTDVTAAFYDCAIYGGTDYIFGAMTAVFAKCDLVFNTSEDGNDVGYITAAQTKSGRGMLMYNCTVTSTVPGVDTASEYTSKAGYFGRPWQTNTGEAVFYNTVIEATDSHWYENSPSLIQAEGWKSTLSGESVMSAEYGTYEMAKDVDNQSARASWATTLTEPKLADGTEISVAAFLGDWDAFAGKDMTVVIPTEKVDNKPADVPSGDTPSETTKFVLDAADVTTFGENTKADGTSEKAGTEGYFTLLYSAKTKVESKAKTFDDGYTSTQRINFGSGATTEKDAIKFTTSNPATVKVWWAAGDAAREMTILNGAGVAVATTTEESAKDALYISTMELTEAGTYYLGGTPKKNYIFKIEVTEEPVAEPIVSVLDAADVTTFGENTKADGASEKAGTEGYFTLLYSAKTKVESKAKTFDDGYTSTQRINFGSGATTEKDAIKFTTSNPATVKVWWAAGDAAREMTILNGAGVAVATTTEGSAKDALYISTMELTEAGTYYLGGTPKKNYIFKVEVTETPGGAVKPPRADWSTVAVPAITDVALDAENANAVVVTVSGNVGYDGADKVTVTMTDAQGKEIASRNSLAEKTEHTLSFEPTASGTYTFSVKAIRDGEEDKVCAENKTFDFVLPLTTPNIKGAYNVGEGVVEVEWDAVKEAEKYIVSVEGTDIAPVETTELIASIEGLEVGKTYTIKVTAVRGEDSVAATIDKTVVNDVETKWYFAAYGQGTNTKNNGYEELEDGSVRVYSTGGKGKIVPGSTDGLAFYYTEIDPSTTNFTLSATAKVNTWTLSNGQEGFGIMAADRVGKHGDSTTFWNNAYMAIASKVEYYYDSETGMATDDSTKQKVSMKLGIGSQEKIGVTDENLAEFNANNTTVINEQFKSTCTTLDLTGAKTGATNVVGNGTNVEGGVTEFKFTIQKNNTGYFVSYTDLEGNTTTKKYYDTEALSKIDTDSVYLGFFASRNCDVTFTDIKFTTVAPEDDAAAEDRPVTLVTPSFKITSATVANSATYDLTFVGNADGALVITDAKGNEVINKTDVKANEKIVTTVEIALGNNKFNVTFTPDADYRPSEYEELDSYDTVRFTHSVLFKSYGEAGDSLYVSPKGTATGNGTKANPLDIYTAVKYVQAGQTIVLMEGTYNLTNTIKVERGINGTADNMIYMVADPEASTRPVFDFGGRCAGMVLAGNYWYFKGFDVTRSADAQKGMQISGKYNVVDQVNAYMNGNTGIQISRYLGTDEYEDWPAYNLILNCTSYLNADKGYEDADGFAAKLTVGDGNVFDGCIAHHNADDGWDLFAKVQSGCIGAVTIQNSVAYKNGYVLDENGNEVNAGNGNGFKMGGDSMSGHHVIKNSIAFLNKAKGIDSNSCPDIEAYDCVSFDNESYNVAFYTNTAANTAYIADGVISYRKNVGMDVAESMKLLGTQDKSKVENAENFYWDVASKTSKNTEGVTVADNWFESLEFTTIDRNEDGTINTHGFLILTEEAKTGSSIDGTGSGDVEIGDETDGKVESGVVVTPSQPEAPKNEETKTESSSSSSTSEPATTVKQTITIPEMETPLAAMPAFGNVLATTVNLTKEAKLQAELLQKYHGKNVYLMAHLGNGVGFTVNAAGVNAQATDLKLETKIEKVEKFAEGFDTVKLTASSEAQLSFNIGVHTNVGVEYVGKTAYLFRKSLVTGQYELAKIMVVNEIGNVALETNEVSDIMILIAK